MELCEINPFLRFAGNIQYKLRANPINVFDGRIFNVTSGRLRIEAEGKTYVLEEGGLFYCPAGSCYCLLTDGYCKVNNINFDISRQRSDIVNPVFTHPLSQGAPIYGREAELSDVPELNEIIVLKDAFDISEEIGKIIKEFSEKRPFFREKCSSMLRGVIIEICRRSLNVKSPALRTVDKVTAYINANLEKKLTNAELSRIAGYHEYHLNRIFLKYTGKTVHQYILLTRVNKGKLYLTASDLSISEIAEQVGFSSSAHFCSSFRELCGESPSKYRNSKRLESI